MRSLIQIEQGLKAKMLEDLERRIARIEKRIEKGKKPWFFWRRTQGLLMRLHEIKMK